MRIVDLLKKEAVVLNAEVSTKEQMLDLLVDLHKEVGNIKDKAAFKAGIMNSRICFFILFYHNDISFSNSIIN